MSTINVQTLALAQNYGHISDLIGRSFNRLSSGLRLTEPSSDPTGAGAVGKLDAQHKRAQAAAINVQNATSYVQSSVSIIASMASLISRMSELSQFAADGTKSADDIALYQTEFLGLQEQLRSTIGGTTAEIGGTTDILKPLGSFNGLPLFRANPTGTSIASGSHAGDTVVMPENNLRDGAMLELIKQDAAGNYTLSITTAGATQTITDAISDLADERSVLAGVGSRLEFAAGSLAVENQNLTAVISRIQDVDVASESTHLTKFNLLLESGAAMLSQANQSPRSVLQLLQN